MKGVMVKEKHNYSTNYGEIDLSLREVFGVDKRPASGMAMAHPPPHTPPQPPSLPPYRGWQLLLLELTATTGRPTNP